MRVWNTWVWPILKGLVVVVIAVALAKVAFFPDAQQDDPAVPTGSLAEPTVRPEPGSIVNTIEVKGTVSQERAQDGKVPMTGIVQEVFVQVGARVGYGETIASIKQETPREPVQNPDGTTTPRDPEVTWHEVTAPASGTVTALNVISRQQVSVGEVAVQVTPSQLLVTGTIPAVQQYRLQQQPTDAQVTITSGPAPFTCTDLKIGALASGTGGSGSSGGTGGTGSSGSGSSGGTGGGSGSGDQASGSSGTTPVSCRIPAEVAAFVGVEAAMTIEGGRVDGVLTLPITAVTGQAGTGTVTVVSADGSRREQPVTLGLSDGTRVEITGGIAETDEVLEFVPSKPRPTQEDCPIDPVTGACIDGAGPVDPGETAVPDDGGQPAETPSADGAGVPDALRGGVA